MKRKRKEKKPHVRLKAVKCGQERYKRSNLAVILTKNTRSNPESSIAFASPHKPVQQSHELQQQPPLDPYDPQKHDNPNYLIQQSIPQSTTSAKKNEPIMPTSSYYEMRKANDAKYAQIRQRHLDAIVQSIIPSIDNTRTSKVLKRNPKID